MLPRISSAAARLTLLKANSPFFWCRSFSSSPGRRSLPRIANPSLWMSAIPKALRERKTSGPQEEKSKGWDPATYFIVMAILIGSEAIQILTLRNEFHNYVRSTDAKIHRLKEVIEKLKRGEEVDIRGALGTGDPKSEAEWHQVIKQIEEEGEEERKPKQKPSSQNQGRPPVKPAEPEPPESDASSQPLPESRPKSKGNFF